MRPGVAQPGDRVRVRLRLVSQNHEDDGETGTVVDHPAASYLLVPVRLDSRDYRVFFHPRNLDEERE